MNIRWRIGILAIQLILLLGTTYYVTGKPFSAENWFLAGMLAVVINPLLFEPHYPRPADVIGNSLIFLFLFSAADRTLTGYGWNISLVFIVIFLLLALCAVLSKKPVELFGKFDINRLALSVSRLASAQRIYSVVFLLSVAEYKSISDLDFWLLVACWALIIIIGAVNWQRFIVTTSLDPNTVYVEGLVGPSMLSIYGNSLPDTGSVLDLNSKYKVEVGLLLKKIYRHSDTWGLVQLVDRSTASGYLNGGSLSISINAGGQSNMIVSVDIGTNDRVICFTTTQDLQIGSVVAVAIGEEPSFVIYQVSEAYLEKTDIKGGSHIFEKVKAFQLGTFSRAELRFNIYPWLAPAGAMVEIPDLEQPIDESNKPEAWERIGAVIGTNLPLFLDLDYLSTGHCAILGMTKMGKSTLCERLAVQLGASRNVTVLDLTGEYVGKKGFPPYSKSTDHSAPGVSVFEPKVGEIPAVRAEEFLKHLLTFAEPEYQNGTPYPRTVIIDEAHQFIPEPSGLGFNAPGRDNSFRIGLLMMHVRKFGISVILISQRTAVIAKSALSQCENLIAFRSVDQTGLDYLESLTGEDIRHVLPRLKQGQAMLLGPAFSSDIPVAVKVDK